MQVTSLLSREPDHKDHKHDHKHDHDHAHDENCVSCGHDHEHTPVRLTQTVVGLIFIINSYIVGGLFQNGDMVANFSAMLGAIINDIMEGNMEGPHRADDITGMMVMCVKTVIDGLDA